MEQFVLNQAPPYQLYIKYTLGAWHFQKFTYMFIKIHVHTLNINTLCMNVTLNIGSMFVNFFSDIHCLSQDILCISQFLQHSLVQGLPGLWNSPIHNIKSLV